MFKAGEYVVCVDIGKRPFRGYKKPDLKTLTKGQKYEVVCFNEYSNTITIVNNKDVRLAYTLRRFESIQKFRNYKLNKICKIYQKEVILSAWQDARIDPTTISYIETHGTGTKLGDPIEIEGITEAFKEYTDKKQFCAIASVKSNIGHAAGAAGIFGLIKTCLSLKHKQLPPSIHFEEPNQKIDWGKSPVYVNTKLSKWKR